MFYIIETEEQLKKFSSYDFSKCIVDVVTNNDQWHLSRSFICLLYIKPYKSRAGFILPISHTESTSISYDKVLNFLNKATDTVYAIDAKRFRYYFSKIKNIHCLKSYYYVKENSAFLESDYDTSAHRFFYNRYDNLENINTVIPICKHYEKLEAESLKLKKYILPYVEDYYYTLYGIIAPEVFYNIEKVGIKVEEKEFDSFFTLKNKEASYEDSKVYTQYNLFTSTGRPSNAFNGVNFAALNKENHSRKVFIPSNDYFLEFDYSSYHLKILCDFIGYQFDQKDIHTHLASFYFGTTDITPEQYSEGKGMTFRLLYTESNIKELEEIPFFKKVRDFKRSLWESYKIEGVVKSFYSGRPLKNIESVTQILPHILQNYETERNTEVLYKIIKLLRNRNTKLVLYCYDSFLFDFSKKDGKGMIEAILDCLDAENYAVSIKYGRNYNDLKVI